MDDKYSSVMESSRGDDETCANHFHRGSLLSAGIGEQNMRSDGGSHGGCNFFTSASNSMFARQHRELLHGSLVLQALNNLPTHHL